MEQIKSNYEKKYSTTKLRLSQKVNDRACYSHVFEFQSDNISPFIDHIHILIYILTLMYYCYYPINIFYTAP